MKSQRPRLAVSSSHRPHRRLQRPSSLRRLPPPQRRLPPRRQQQRSKHVCSCEHVTSFFSNPLPSWPQSSPDSWLRWYDFRRITASTGGRDTPKSWVLSGKHMMMGPACFSDRAVHVATHGFLLLIYNFWVFYGVRPFRSCGSVIAMTGADDAHGNV